MTKPQGDRRRITRVFRLQGRSKTAPYRSGGDMATYSEIEDMQAWFISNCGEMEAKLAVLNGDEPEHIIRHINETAQTIRKMVVVITSCFDELLILKKKEEYSEGD